jgi:hypothetical protein
MKRFLLFGESVVGTYLLVKERMFKGTFVQQHKVTTEFLHTGRPTLTVLEF